MFFLPATLRPQQKHRMSMAWLAATVGLTKLQKNKIIELDVIKLCGDITRFLQSDSSNPKKRVSLRLATILIHGTVLLWNRQVKFCIDGALNCIMIIQEKECENMKDGLTKKKAELQPKVVVKRVRAKKQLADNLQINWEINIPQETIEKLFSKESSFMTRRLADITLREDEPLRQRNDPESEWFGERQLPALPGPDIQVPEILVQPAVSVIPLPEELPIEAIPTEVVVELPEQIPPPVAQAEDIILPHPREDQDADKENQPPAQILPTTEEPASKQLLDSVEIPQDIPKKTQNIKKALYVKRGKPKVVSINQIMERYEDEADYTELVKSWDVSLPPFVAFKNFWSVPIEEQEVVSRHLQSELSLSGPSDMRNILSAGGSTLEPTSLVNLFGSQENRTPSAHGQSSVSSRGALASISPRKRPVVETFVEELPPAANGRRISTKKLRKLPIESSLMKLRERKEKDDIVNLPIGNEFEVPAEPRIRSQEPLEFGMKWTARIMALLDEYAKLTHEEICKHLNERLTKRNIATIFACLLGKMSKCIQVFLVVRNLVARKTLAIMNN